MDTASQAFAALRAAVHEEQDLALRTSRYAAAGRGLSPLAVGALYDLVGWSVERCVSRLAQMQDPRWPGDEDEPVENRS